MPDSNGKTILLIEDEQSIADMYVRKLSDAGFSITHCPDGDKGWQALKDSSYDLLLLDVVLPHKDGFEILSDIRKDNTLHSLKVFLLTNLMNKADKEKGEKLGADSYLVKAHLTPTQLVEIVTKALT